MAVEISVQQQSTSSPHSSNSFVKVSSTRLYTIITVYYCRDLPDIETTPDTSTALLFIDTGGCSIYERETESDEESKGNEGEQSAITVYWLS